MCVESMIQDPEGKHLFVKGKLNSLKTSFGLIYEPNSGQKNFLKHLIEELRDWLDLFCYFHSTQWDFSFCPQVGKSYYSPIDNIFTFSMHLQALNNTRTGAMILIMHLFVVSLSVKKIYRQKSWGVDILVCC